MEHSLVYCFPKIDTKLKCPYYVICGTPQKRKLSPLSLSRNQNLLDVAVTLAPAVSAEELHSHTNNFPVSVFPYVLYLIKIFSMIIQGFQSKKKKSRFNQIASMLKRKQSHKVWAIIICISFGLWSVMQVNSQFHW